MEIQILATLECELLAFIALARLVGAQRGESRQRKRKMTEVYREARQAGLQPLGYLQVEK
jgi:hypothetical protein